MTERIEYVHMHFNQSVQSPKHPNPHGSDKSVYLDAFEGAPEARKRILKIEREVETHTVVITHIESGRVRDYPWGNVRQGIRADERYVDSDPRWGKLKPKPEAKGKVA